MTPTTSPVQDCFRASAHDLGALDRTRRCFREAEAASDDAGGFFRVAAGVGASRQRPDSSPPQESGVVRENRGGRARRWSTSMKQAKRPMQ